MSSRRQAAGCASERRGTRPNRTRPANNTGPPTRLPKLPDRRQRLPLTPLQRGQNEVIRNRTEWCAIGCGEKGGLKLTAAQAAHRELDIAKTLSGRTLQHVVPILDSGQDSDSDRYFIVMPLCERNLQEVIDSEGGPLPLDTALDALRAIVAGLLEVSDIVHRDLKPANVLFHDGRWKLADFGIAKFVEDSTSLETLRASLTPPYAAPEQWRVERPTSATDVYALGCVLHALTTGKPPFSGTVEQLRDAHLQTIPAPITACPPRLATFASLMLRKPVEARPTLLRCRDIFAENHIETKSLSPARQALSDAASHVEQRTAREDAARIQREQLSARRNELARNANSDLTALVAKIDDNINHFYERAKRGPGDMLYFGAARFGLTSKPKAIDQHWWQQSGLQSFVERLRWDIVSSSSIAVTAIPSIHGRDYTWSASLIYADRKDGQGYRWYELAFYTSALSRNHGQRDEPYALEVRERDFFQALSPAMHTVAVAYGPFPIDGEDEPQFIERWLGLVAKAATGQLEPPRSMPIHTWPAAAA